MAINKEWHLAHRMPKNPSEEQRALWHIEHTRHCQCRQPSAKEQELINNYLAAHPGKDK